MVDTQDKLAPYLDGLNSGQVKTFHEVLEFFEGGPEEAFVLRGYAGTGKTFLVKRLVRYITDHLAKKKIAITAPTNKAVRVLQEMGGFEGKQVHREKDHLFDFKSTFQSSIQYCTIHKLLGLKERITKTGEQIFTADKRDNNDITKYHYLIVDEVSMLNDSLCKDIMKHCKKVKILFMGDPAQIPPVKKVDCIPFRDDHPYLFKRALLEEIMRQKGEHPVVESSFIIRENLDKNQPIPVLETKLNDSGNGLIYYHSSNDRDSVRPMLNTYFNCEEFKKNANYAKVIAWRNVIVNYMNKTVREILYGDDPEAYVIGEKLIVSKPIFGDYGIIFNTSEELEVVDIKIKDRTFSRGQHKLQAKVFDLKVEAKVVGSDTKIKRSIEVIHPDDMPEYKRMIAAAHKVAVKAFNDKRLWLTYYELIKWSADVAYNYAITAHKAQGSSYNNVLIIEEDLDKNPKTRERNRIKYTAYSRAVNKLFILRENYGT